MNILYLGDIMGESGIEAVRRVLLEWKKRADLVVAQAENVSEGKSMTLTDMQRLRDLGVDFFTGGNHTPALEVLHAALEDDAQPVIGPANMPDCPGKGWKYIATPKGQVLVISILGQTVGKAVTTTNPLAAIDRILDENRTTNRLATIVNFHGDYSSEKRVIGYYLDGRVSAVIGDHWHVPTADAMVLPKGTAHITDVGMCGTVHSSLGVKIDTIVARWRDGLVNKNILETEGALQANAVLVQVNDHTGLANQIELLQKVM